MTNYRVEIGMRLGRLRNENLMTQEKLAERCGISVEYYRVIEKGEYLPNISIVNCIHDLGWDIDFILTGNKAEASVFSGYLGGVEEGRRNNICNLLLYQMRRMLNDSGYLENSEELPYDTLIRDAEYMSYTPNERIKEILLNERRYTDFKIADIAKDLSISEKTVSR